MTYTLKDARKLADELFQRSTDYTGVPYMDHLEVVAGALEMFDEDLQVVGLLHSVLEHTDWTSQMLLDEGVPSGSVDTIVAMTHDKIRQTHAAYFRQVKASEDASLVKLACVAHNFLPERLDLPRLKWRTNRVVCEGFSERHLWTSVYEDDLRDILQIVHPELLDRVHRLKEDGKL